MRIQHCSILACAASVAIAVMSDAAGVAVGGLVDNGDFEDTTAWGDPGTLYGPPGWSIATANPAAQQSGAEAIGGSGTSALMLPGIVGKLVQSFGETLPRWRLDADFASQDPGGVEDRSFSGSMFNGSNALITYRINGDGDFQVYDRGGLEWYTPAGLAGAVNFDSDVRTTPLTHHLSLMGNFDLPNPSYDVIVTDAYGGVHQSLGLTSWNKPIVGDIGVGPTSGQGITGLDLPTTLSSGQYLLDNVSVISRPAANALAVGQSNLFVDDAMVAARSGLVRTAHAAQKLEQAVLEAEMPWEMAVEYFGEDKRIYVYGTVLYDKLSSQFRMWYLARPNSVDTVCYATSQDGLNWERPNLGLVNFDGSTDNNILPITFHSPNVICDKFETDDSKRYKMVGSLSGSYRAAYSQDGLTWTQYSNPIISGGDTCTLAQNPETGEYLFFFKKTHEYLGETRRLVYLSTSMDMENWSTATLVMAPDAIDDAQTQDEGGLYSQFYNMSVFPQGGQFLGLVTHFRYTGPPEETGPGQSSHDGPIDVQIVTSRDGYTWQRSEDRSPVIPNGPYDYDAGCILGVTNGPITVGDEQWIYYSGITTTHGGYLPDKEISIARAAWRRDGFVSLDADSDGGTVVTLPFELQAKNLFINATTETTGGILVELLDETGEVISGYSLEDCNALSGDSLDARVTWSGLSAIGDELLGQTVSLRFYLQDATLYSYLFRYSPGDANGDNLVDQNDAAILAANWLSRDGVGWAEGDFNDDGVVDDVDAVLMAVNWNPGTSTNSGAKVPEPGVLLLLVAGLLTAATLSSTQRFHRPQTKQFCHTSFG